MLGIKVGKFENWIESFWHLASEQTMNTDNDDYATCWNREFELLYTTKREIEFQEIQKYQWNAQKIPDIMVKCFSSGGHFAASEAVK